MKSDALKFTPSSLVMSFPPSTSIRESLKKGSFDLSFSLAGNSSPLGADFKVWIGDNEGEKEFNGPLDLSCVGVRSIDFSGCDGCLEGVVVVDDGNVGGRPVSLSTVIEDLSCKFMGDCGAVWCAFCSVNSLFNEVGDKRSADF